MAKVIGKRIKMVDCENCNSIVEFDWDDVRDESRYGYTYSYVKCPCCKKDIMIMGKVSQYYRLAAEMNNEGCNVIELPYVAK